MENSTFTVYLYNFTNHSCNYSTCTEQTNAMPEQSKYALVSNFFYTYVCPPFVVAGILCNLLTFVILLRPPFKAISVSIYLKAYCISAILAWIFVIGLNWIYDKMEFIYFQNINQISCRVASFLTSTIPFAGLWFLTGAALDRVFILWIPVKAQLLCTGFMAKNAVAFIIVGLTAVSIHAMWMYDWDAYCTFDMKEYYNLLWMWISAFLLGCLPLFSLFILANMMIIRLCLKHHGRQIPDLSKNEMDITYSIIIISFIVFSTAMPSNVLHFFVIYDNNNYLKVKIHQEFATYISWLCYICVFLVLLCRCSAFRDALRDLFRDCAFRLGRRNAGIELKTMKPEYNQVPSTSTCV